MIEVGYLYRDPRKDDRGDGLGRECSACGERRFTLGKDTQASRWDEMTGRQRTAGTA